ncbi:helix-turn-helix transcriptional regulator [Aquicoccus sp. SU-CL01552]|uniref:helix-turn-helix transcriptional regulator n=1 Tax=Aquicoccus sp. SU-CL01552 TaxID=3127656 RepID=UPI003104AE1C
MDDLRLVTLAQLAKAGAWQLELAHDRAEHLLIWITRGQGVALLDGARHGIGTHNALFIPARNLMALELMRNGFGQALVIPDGANLTLPQTVQHLRIRDVAAQAELTVLFEAMGREQNAQRPLYHSAMRAYGDLMAVWLRRHLPDDPAPGRSAAQRLVTAFCDRLVRDYADGSSMADHAEALGVTPTHLTRVCRAETGRTAATLLTERLLHAARTLLISTDVPVQDIARHLGFGSAAYFTRFIQQHTQKTPTALRKSVRSAA